MKKENVLVFGYSDSPDRYSNMAYHLLLNFEHKALAFNPRTDDPKILTGPFDTITLYVNPQIGLKFKDLLTSIPCNRVIFNPGTESPELEKAFSEQGREVIHGCTLVMLRTNQY